MRLKGEALSCGKESRVPFWNRGCVRWCRYGDGTIRLTVEQDVIFPNIPEASVGALRKEPIFQKYSIDPGNLTRGLVSCTGAQVWAECS